MTTHNDGSLKPCPCCGTPAKVPWIHENKMWSVWCSECGLRTDQHHTEERAIAAWNRRAQPDAAAIRDLDALWTFAEAVQWVHMSGNFTDADQDAAIGIAIHNLANAGITPNNGEPRTTYVLKSTTPAEPEERNFCQRCGKRNEAPGHIHTCTPPADHIRDATKMVQEGYVLVPVEPNNAMLDAGRIIVRRVLFNAGSVWDAMIAAAPSNKEVER